MPIYKKTGLKVSDNRFYTAMNLNLKFLCQVIIHMYCMWEVRTEAQHSDCLQPSGRLCHGISMNVCTICSKSLQINISPFSQQNIKNSRLWHTTANETKRSHTDLHDQPSLNCRCKEASSPHRGH